MYIQMLCQCKPKYLLHQRFEYVDSVSQFVYDALYMKCIVPVLERTRNILVDQHPDMDSGTYKVIFALER